MKNLIQNFRFRKIALAMSDAFIVAVSSFMTNFLSTFQEKNLLYLLF